MILRALLFIWQAPATVPIWLVYVFPMWLLGGLDYIDTYRGVLVFRPTARIIWHMRLWDRNVNGMALPYCIIIKSWRGNPTPPWVLPHEHRHTQQWAVLGPLFLPAYLVGMLVALVRYQRPYWMCFLEVDARENGRLDVE